MGTVRSTHSDSGLTVHYSITQFGKAFSHTSFYRPELVDELIGHLHSVESHPTLWKTLERKIQVQIPMTIDHNMNTVLVHRSSTYHITDDFSKQEQHHDTVSLK
jgi:hypothetical protein